jgi:hypothetical protein
VNRSDRDITRGMLSADSHCCFRGHNPWPPALKKARMKVEILKLALSMSRTGKDCQIYIDKLLGLYGDLLEIPNKVKSIQIVVHLAQSGFVGGIVNTEKNLLGFSFVVDSMLHLLLLAELLQKDLFGMNCWLSEGLFLRLFLVESLLG